jgi:hypothetical protein
LIWIKFTYFFCNVIDNKNQLAVGRSLRWQEAGISKQYAGRYACGEQIDAFLPTALCLLPSAYRSLHNV